MTIKTGTRTRWEEFELGLRSAPGVVYMRPGHVVEEEIDYLVEAVRADGVANNLGTAYRMVESARFVVGWYGIGDDGILVECDEAGETSSGELVDPQPCVYAVL